MKAYSMIAGPLIRQRRIELGYPQKYIGSFLGYGGKKPDQIISNIEGGRCALPPHHCKKVSELLEIPFEKLQAALVEDASERIRLATISGESHAEIV
jgi:hypothetical protein